MSEAQFSVIRDCRFEHKSKNLLWKVRNTDFQNLVIEESHAYNDFLNLCYR